MYDYIWWFFYISRLNYLLRIFWRIKYTSTAVLVLLYYPYLRLVFVESVESRGYQLIIVIRSSTFSFIFKLHIPKLKCILKVHEDNQSCIAMANNPKFTPRAKHIAIKYYHFWKHVKIQSNKDGFIEIVYCSTDNQTADIFTTPTRDDIFSKLRQLFLEW